MRRSVRRRAGILVAAVTVLVGLADARPDAMQIGRDEALALAFPDAVIEAERIFLTTAQRDRIAELSGEPVTGGLVARYVASRDGAPVGRAYIDTHVVRTKRESLLISLDRSGAVQRIDVTAFLEPTEYMAPDAWMAQYPGRTLTDDLELDRAIRTVAGATLTARATNAAVRRVLAIDQVLEAGEGS